LKKPQHTLDGGTRIGSFEINHVLGIGGFGITYKGYDHTLECDVAIKEYLPEDFASRNSDKITVMPLSDNDRPVYNRGLEQFLQEARTLAKFKAPNIVRVNRYIETNGTAYIIMDYEDGEPLSRYLKSRKTLTEKRIREILIPVLKGLKIIHNKNVLHRDIKPGNIYLRKSGEPVLLDFGAARQAIQQDEQNKTETVTPGYAPFEQYSTRGSQGPWTDLYSLGATIYHCITGKAPVPAPDRIAALNSQTPDPVLNLQNITNSLYSVELLDIVNWLLKPLPQDRPQSADKVLAKIQTDAKNSTDAIQEEKAIEDIAATTMVSAIDKPVVMWTEELLRETEQTLATYMGPLAKILVPQAAYKASTLEEFLTTLANTISSHSVRQHFLKTMRARAPALMPEAISPDSLEDNPDPLAPDSELSENSISSISVKSWSPDFLQEIEDKLAIYVGPLAHMLVQKAAKRANNTQKLYKLLASDLPDDKQRKDFMSTVSRRSC